MSKIYSVMELANALQVHPSTITYWVDTNKLTGTKDASGRMHFTDEQVMKCLISKHTNSLKKDMSVLYIVDGKNEDEYNTMMEKINQIQKKIAPKSVFIDDIETFLMSCENSTSEVAEKDLKKYENIVKANIIKEVSNQLEKYVYNKIHYLGELDDRYSAFSLNELKSLILADVDKDLIDRFDAIMNDIKANPSDKGLTAEGQIKSNYVINAAFLRITLENRMTEIAKTVGIADEKFLFASARQLLSYDKLVDKDTCDLMASNKLKINYNHPFVQKVLKSVVVQQKNNGIIAKIKKMVSDGYYYVVKYYEDKPGTHQYIYNLLDDNTFKSVVYMGKSKLAEQITFKLNSQISKGQIDFTKTELDNSNK